MVGVGPGGGKSCLGQRVRAGAAYYSGMGCPSIWRRVDGLDRAGISDRGPCPGDTDLAGAARRVSPRNSVAPDDVGLPWGVGRPGCPWGVEFQCHHPSGSTAGFCCGFSSGFAYRNRSGPACCVVPGRLWSPSGSHVSDHNRRRSRLSVCRLPLKACRQLCPLVAALGISRQGSPRLRMKVPSLVIDRHSGVPFSFQMPVTSR